MHVVVDGSDSALDACAWSARYAVVTGAPMVLVHSTFCGARGSESTETLRSIGLHALFEAAVVARNASPRVRLETCLTSEPLVSFVRSVSNSAGLVVVVSPRSTAVTDIFVGGEAIRICGASRAPVLVWRDRPTDDPAVPVVVRIDDSSQSERAIDFAFEYARAVDAPLLAVDIWQVRTNVGVGYGACVVDWGSIRVEQERWVRERVDGVRDRYSDVRSEVLSMEGSTARCLAEISRGARMVVVGSRVRSPIAGVLTGSVSHSLIRHAECPVLVVH